MIKLLWSEREAIRTMKVGDARHRAIEAFEVAAAALPTGYPKPSELEAYRAAQFAVFKALQGQDTTQPGWPISDLITVGSPLAHAQFLLEKDAPALEKGKAERRFPINPPFRTREEPLLYDRKEPADGMRLHHAAPFAAVRWTNIYDPPTAILWGDCISGPVQPVLGHGTTDVSVEIRSNWGRLFTHSRYWTDTGGKAPQLRALRVALGFDHARS